MNKFKKRVLKDYPKAQLVYTEFGYRVMDNEHYIAEEYFMPETTDPIKAWEYAALTCKTTQHFNRTHPGRMDLSKLESRLKKFDARRQKRQLSNDKKIKKYVD